MDPIDLAIIDSLGSLAAAPMWRLRMQVDEPWTFSVDEFGIVETIEWSTFKGRAELWYLPDQDLESRPTEGRVLIRRIVEPGRTRVEDIWSPDDGRYRRMIAAEDEALNKRLARYVFDAGPWGAGRPAGRETSANEILTAIVAFREENHRDPSQPDLLKTVPYGDVKSLQRALDDLSWQEALEWASQVEADRAAYPGKVVIRGVVSFAKNDR